MAEPLNCTIPDDVSSRISKARSFLQGQLEVWDVKASENVGFEILVPTLLQLLEQEGFNFNVPGLPALKALGNNKLAQFDPRMLYDSGQTRLTLVHSLEAFIGTIEFNNIGHLKASGSMMASPAATAAYLMNSSNWDEEAEQYLSTVIATGSGKGGGGVLSAFPTLIFELSWVLSTLLLAGFNPDDLGLENVGFIGDFLEQHLHAANGLLGFAPDLLADADDTAKTILSLSLLKRSASPAQMIAEFETETYFKTYIIERNPSFSANCNVLCALLYGPDPNIYADQIFKAASFLCKSWWEGPLKDKWALVRLLRVWDSGRLSGLSDKLAIPSRLSDQIPVVLFQILVRTLRSQDPTVSWGSQSHETTAYAVLTLVYLSSLPWASALKPEIEAAIASGRLFLGQFISSGSWLEEPDQIWIEKVSYGSTVLSQTYCLAAMNAPMADDMWGNAVLDLTSVPLKSVEGFLHFFSRLPLFQTPEKSKWKLRSLLIEGYLFLPRLKRISRDIFPRYKMTEDKYLEYIPLTWTTTNRLQETPLSANFLEEMMEISMLNYQTDEFMEAVVGEHFEGNLGPIREIVRSFFEQPIKLTNRCENGIASKTSRGGINGFGHRLGGPEEPLGSVSPNTVKHTLGRFVHHVLDHPKIIKASVHDQRNLRRELQAFLFAHMVQIEDNYRFSHQVIPGTTIPFLSPKSTYFSWVHTTSAEHTSCPYSFAFVICLTSLGASDCFKGAYSKYLAQDLCCHLAVMCWQYNDYGSIKRDRQERNLNSVNFPEFHTEAKGESQRQEFELGRKPEVREDEIKAELFEIAEYERNCMMKALYELKKRVPARVINMLGLFVGVTDLYGQIYVARDIASRMR
ncbi:MAG: hypothetical protein Q9187_000684 [Circinaria calcarea]